MNSSPLAVVRRNCVPWPPPPWHSCPTWRGGWWRRRRCRRRRGRRGGWCRCVSLGGVKPSACWCWTLFLKSPEGRGLNSTVLNSDKRSEENLKDPRPILFAENKPGHCGRDARQQKHELSKEFCQKNCIFMINSLKCYLSSSWRIQR